MSQPNIVRISPKILQPRIPELGSIRIGMKGEERKTQRGATFRLPTKLTHFIVVRRTRDAADNFERDATVHDKVGFKPTELDVRLMFDEPAANFQYFLAAYDGMTKRCSGDGEQAWDTELGKIPCTCPWLKQHTGTYQGPERPAQLDKRPAPVCKPHGRLSVILEAAATYGGFYVFRTTSWETISSIAGQLEAFNAQFGYLAGLPLKLVMYPTEDRYVENGREKKSKSFKVALVLRASFDAAYQLAAAAHERRRSLQLPAGRDAAAQHIQQMREAEERDAAEIAAEFHPPASAVAADDADGGSSDESPDYEVVTEEEEEQAADEAAERELEELCRFALELADWEAPAINKQVAKYTADLPKLAEMIQRELPTPWAQANKASAERQAAAPEQEPDTTQVTTQQELLS